MKRSLLAFGRERERAKVKTLGDELFIPATCWCGSCGPDKQSRDPVEDATTVLLTYALKTL